MRAMLSLGLAWVMLIGSAAGQEGDKEAKALIDKALQAVGGAEKVNKYAAFAIKGKGKINIMNMELDLAIDIFVQMPGQVRQDVELEINNMKITTIQVFDGKKGWLKQLNETKELDDEKLIQEFKEGINAQRAASLYKLDKGFTFSTVGDAKVKDKAAVGVRVSHKGFRDINLFFDKQKGLLVKAEYRALDPLTMKEVGREEYFSNYKEVNGVQTAHKMAIFHDGEKFLDLEVTDVRYLEKHDEGTFAKP